MNSTWPVPQRNGLEIAVIGLAGRFPQAENADRFWKNLQAGAESIALLSDEELQAAGHDLKTLNHPNFVRASAALKEVEWFDAPFFSYHPREAEIIDPQHRVFLECAWEAMENAGYDSESYAGSIGVYAGTNMSTYLYHNLASNRAVAAMGSFQIKIANDKDGLSMRVSYKLNLEGPSLTVQTACSTSLVAIHLACQSLLSGECDICLAGGVSIAVSQKPGYIYQEGMILSPDGHCRAFDARAQGTVAGDGVGIVVLKRLEDALADGDRIHAIIKGSAINNDGSNKVGYTAPRAEGQAKVIRAAHLMAEVDPESISYIETHGTGTLLGDPIEVAAMTQAFRMATNAKHFCGIGSVKSNIGHLDAAAGVAGLIKTVLALEHRQIPPSLHFETPNPKIDFANSPFYVNTTLAEWKRGGTPRRAGVSAFGIGGTNAHVVLEEAPAVEKSGASRPFQVLLLSAPTSSALEKIAANLTHHLRQPSEFGLPDVAYTLQLGRRRFHHRRAVICRDLKDAIDALETNDSRRVLNSQQESKDRPVAFLFPGQGSQYLHMGLGFYQHETIFRQHVDECVELLRPQLGLNLRNILYPVAPGEPELNPEETSAASVQLEQTSVTQPALFVVEYALARLWMSWGLEPRAMLGHSIGEYVAACLAGVFTLNEALALVATRGRLMQGLPPGSMLMVPLSEADVRPLLNEQLCLAALNGPTNCVLSGPPEAVDELHMELTKKKLVCRQLSVTRAFHSAMMEPILERFAAEVRKVRLKAPTLPYLSNLTGHWITAADATNPDYWVSHLRQTVQFVAGAAELLKETKMIFLEVGPGQTLTNLIRRLAGPAGSVVQLCSLRNREDSHADELYLMRALAKLWLEGVRVNWPGFYAKERRHRVPLPTYPFERERYWVEPQRPSKVPQVPEGAPRKNTDLNAWFYLPTWHEVFPSKAVSSETAAKSGEIWLVFADDTGLAEQAVGQLKARSEEVVLVARGPAFLRSGDRHFIINPGRSEDIEQLVRELHAQKWLPTRVLHMWGVTPGDAGPPSLGRVESTLNGGFFSLVDLMRALSDRAWNEPLTLTVVTTQLADVAGETIPQAEKALVLGPCTVIPQEFPQVRCCIVDVIAPSLNQWPEALVNDLLAEVGDQHNGQVLAWRRGHRWVRSFERVCVDEAAHEPMPLRKRGVYLITGGLGGIGLVLAEELAKSLSARLVLLGRSALPSREMWANWLASHPKEDSVSKRIKQVQALELSGAEVLILSADVTNAQQMRAAFSQAERRFGVVHGVIHSAGVPGGGIIPLKSREAAATVLAPKVQGTLVLQSLLAGRPLDFIVLCSSLASQLGGVGQVDYCAANAFLDAWAQSTPMRATTRVVAINWDTWQEVGMAVETSVPGLLQSWRHESVKQGISPQEGVEAFRRAINLRSPQVLVSTLEFNARLQSAAAAGHRGLTEAAAPTCPIQPRHTRPALLNDYVSPRTELEAAIAVLWEELLGFEQIGVHDDFFELGGHSLLATQLVTRLRETFQIELNLQVLFEAPTIADLAPLIVARESTAGQVENIARLLRSIQVMPTEMVEQMLESERSAPEPL